MRRLFLASAISLALASGPACKEFLPRVEEHLRLERLDNLNASQLGFEKGKTTLEDAEIKMKASRLTGIAKGQFIGDNIPLVSVISADYQTSFHVFDKNLYSGSFDVHAGEVVPYGMALRLATSNGKLYLLALYRDPMDLTSGHAYAAEPRISILRKEGDSFVFLSTHSLGALTKENGGLTSPLFVGHDLDMGLMFIARDRRGEVWDNAYIVHMQDEKLSTRPISISAASRCSCIEGYLYDRPQDPSSD